VNNVLACGMGFNALIMVVKYIRKTVGVRVAAAGIH
jgi:hypothetical protein